MPNKKEYPLVFLELIEPYLDGKWEFVELVDNVDGDLLTIKDKDPQSDFCFTIEKLKVEANVLQLYLYIQPKDINSTGFGNFWAPAKSLEKYFNDWLSLVQRFEHVRSPFDDPILSQYEQEFYADFVIIEDDAEYVSFNLDQHLFFDNYLSDVLIALDGHIDDDNENQIAEIKEEVNDLKKKLTITSKKATIEKLSRIWAKIRKVGLPILKDIYIQSRNELIKMLIQGQLAQ